MFFNDETKKEILKIKGSAFFVSYRRFENTLYLQVADDIEAVDRYVAFIGTKLISGPPYWHHFSPNFYIENGLLVFEDIKSNVKIISEDCGLMDENIEINIEIIESNQDE